MWVVLLPLVLAPLGYASDARAQRSAPAPVDDAAQAARSDEGRETTAPASEEAEAKAEGDVKIEASAEEGEGEAASTTSDNAPAKPGTLEPSATTVPAAATSTTPAVDILAAEAIVDNSAPADAKDAAPLPPLPEDEAGAEGGLGVGGDLGGEGDLGLQGDFSGGSIEALDLEEMLGTVSAVSRRSESVLKAPATVTTIPARRIRLSGMKSVPELLRTVPGVQVVRSAAGNFLVSLRGLGGLQGNNVVVVIDGVPVNSRVDGSVDWASLPVHTDDIESIEVVRGPISSIWGANAYTGVINIVTRRAQRDVSRSRVGLGVGMDVDGDPIASGVGSVGSTLGPVAWDVSLNAVHDESMSRAAAVDDDTPRVRQPALTGLGAMYKANVELFGGAHLDFVGGSSFSSRSGIGHLSFNNQEQESLLSFGRLELSVEDLPLSIDSVSLWLRGKTLSLNVDRAEDVVSGFSYDDLTSHDGELGFDVRLDLPWELAASFGAVSGLAFVDAPFVHPAENAKLRPSYGAYANADIDILEAVVLTAGVRSDSSAMVEGFELSYRASALYYNELFGVRLAAGSAYREPSHVEVGARFIDPKTNLIQLEGTPGLAAPRVDAAELSVIIVPVSTLRIQPTVYVERVHQLIVEDFGPLARKTFRNTEEAEIITGGELESSWTFLENYSLYGSVSLLWWPLEGESSDLTTLAEAPLNSAVTGYAAFQGRWFDDRLGGGVGAGLASSRTYDARAGIPPQLIDVEVPNTFYLDAAVNGRPIEHWPVWLWSKVLSHLPPAATESPYRGAAALGTRVMVGVEYRPE